MKYINTNKMIFDSVTDLKQNDNGIFCPVNNGTNGYAYIQRKSASDVIHVKFKTLYTNTETSSTAATNVCRIYLDGGGYIFFYYNTSYGYCNVGDWSNRYGTKTVSGNYNLMNNKWNTVYLKINFTEAKIYIHINGLLVEIIEISRIKDERLSYVAMMVKSYSDSMITTFKDIIITDEDFKQNENVMDIPVEIVSAEWDEAEGVFSTEKAGKKIIYKADLSAIGRHNIKSIQLGFKESQSSETISKVRVRLGGNESINDLSDSGNSIYTEAVPNPDMSGEISIESMN